MSRRLDFRREEGFALVLVMLLIIVLTILSVTLMELVQTESSRSSKSIRSGTAYQAAEAGVDDYIAKLLDDHLYYDHYVHAGESTRRTSSATNVAAGAAWPGGPWTYPNGKDFFNSAKLSSGYEYNLQITPPSQASPFIKILATGRRSGSTTDQRSIEAWVRPSSLSDFQMLANADISYGSTATTSGKIYAGIDDSGVKHNVNHDGTASANIYAEGDVTGSTTLTNGAKKFDKDTNPDIRSEIKQPVNFNSLVVSLVDVQNAAQNAAGIYLNNATKDAWRLTFLATGQVQVQSCTQNGGQDVALAAPNCGTVTTYSVPANGAIYTGQTAIVSGVVDGRVTVASNNNVVVPADISYEVAGDDVLGLVAKNDVIVAQWSPTNVSWRAATLAQSGRWRSYSTDGSHGTMTFTGSTATNLGGYMNMFTIRNYNYDPTLAYLQPPWFPTVEGAYTIVLFREVTP